MATGDSSSVSVSSFNLSDPRYAVSDPDGGELLATLLLFY